MNDMRKLMEAVEQLFDSVPVGFKNVTVSSDADDVYVDGEPLPVKLIWVYDDAGSWDNQGELTQGVFSSKEYNKVLRSVVDSVRKAVDDAYKETDELTDGEYFYDYFAIGADVSPDINDKLISDLIKELDLSDIPSSRSDNNRYMVFNIERPKKKKWRKINGSVNEVALRRDDEDWDDYSDERTEPDQEMKDAPYYVEWNAQSWEWYGDDDPSTGRGRYKPKGDGGRVVAINVPTFAQAQQIADKLDSDYEDGSFEDKNVYGTQGDDGYVLDYHGSNIRSMAKMDEYTERELKHVHPNFQPKDFGG